MKNIINKILSKTTGYHLTKSDLRKDKIFLTQKYLCKGNDQVVIFDVGAFIGNTVKDYLKYFGNKCDIFSFEPYPESFANLQKNTNIFSNVKAYNLALGDRDGSTELHVNKFLATNSILPTDPAGIKAWGEGMLETESKIDVPMLTIDTFCEEHDIAQIDILKMDTQGTENMVLKGAEKSIKEGKIKVIFAEIIVISTYSGQMDFDEIFKMYKEYGYELYSLFISKDENEKTKFMDGIFVYNAQKDQ